MSTNKVMLHHRVNDVKPEVSIKSFAPHLSLVLAVSVLMHTFIIYLQQTHTHNMYVNICMGSMLMGVSVVSCLEMKYDIISSLPLIMCLTSSP